jgi:hypothetical protein
MSIEIRGMEPLLSVMPDGHRITFRQIVET